MGNAAQGAAAMAQEAGVKRLVLVHIGPHLSQQEVKDRTMKDLNKIYDGEILFSDELMTINF